MSGSLLQQPFRLRFPPTRIDGRLPFKLLAALCAFRVPFSENIMSCLRLQTYIECFYACCLN